MLLDSTDREANDDHAEIHDLRSSGFKGKVMSLFCEPSPSFSSLDPGQGLSSSGTEKASRRSRRHTKRLSESAPDANLESKPKKASLSLTPWKQESGRSRTFTTLCGDGLFYAAGGMEGLVLVSILVGCGLLRWRVVWLMLG